MIQNEYEKELERLEKLKHLVDEINSIEIETLFVSQKKLAQVLGCSERAAGELMHSPGFPLIKVGGKAMVNIFALNEYTQHRVVLSEMKKGA